MDCGMQKGLQKTLSSGFPGCGKDPAGQEPARGWSPKAAVSVLAGRDESQPSNKFPKGLWSHQHSWLPWLTISNMAYRSSSINIILSYLFILMRSSVNTTEVVCAVTWPGVKLGGVICRGQVLQESVCSHVHVNLAQLPKAWKMKQYFGWWHNQRPATMIPPTLTSQKQLSYKQQPF